MTTIVLSMMSFKIFRNSILSLSVAVAVLLPSCTSVDNTLGGDIIHSDKFSIHIDTLGLAVGERIQAYQVYYDSIGLAASQNTKRGAMNLTINYIGSAYDPVFGRIEAASIATALPTSPQTPNLFKNRRSSSFDSVKLVVNMKYVCGDHSVPQTFNIYRLKDSLAYSTDSIYYQNFRYENHIVSEPLFSFDYSGVPDEIEEIKLKVLPQGELMLNELAATDTLNFYSDHIADFLAQYKGFVIARAESSDSNAAIYANYLPNTLMNFYFQRDRDQWEIDRDYNNKSKTVTAMLQLYMSDAEATKNTSVASLRHDFSGTKFENIRTEMVPAPEVAYIEGMGGITTLLDFPDTFFESIEALKPSPKYGLFINQAQLFIWLEEQTVEAYDKAFQAIGAYMDYGKLTPIADYPITDSSTAATTAFDGTLNRTIGKGYYMLDITSFLQHAVQNADRDSRRIVLGGTYTPYTPFADSTSVLKTANSDQPVRVKLTYTLMQPEEV